MASGDTLLEFPVIQGTPTATLAATFEPRTGGSTPAESFYVADFDAATDEYLDFHGLIMPQHYSGGGVTVRLIWGASSATSNNCIWRAAFRSIEDDAEDVDGAHSYDFNSVTDAAPSASGEFTAAAITFTDGADMDNVGAGDVFTLRVTRDADNGSDNMTGDAELKAIEIRET